MNITLNRVIIFGKDIPALAAFYQRHFQFTVTENIDDEWIILKAGDAEIAFHKQGNSFVTNSNSRGENSNTKLVFLVDTDLEQFREKLIAEGVSLKESRSFSDGILYCDGVDIEGNIFQLMQKKSQIL